MQLKLSDIYNIEIPIISSKIQKDIDIVARSKQLFKKEHSKNKKGRKYHT
jgi:hypothetical protein